MNLLTTNQIFIKLFYYEFKRILFHKFYLGILLIGAIYNWLILKGEIILGISHTAPFSGWSFGVYLGHSIPLLLFLIYFFFYQLYYGTNRQIRVLTLATPISPSYYLLIRCTAILAAVLLFIILEVMEGILFFYSLFPLAVSIKELLAPICFIYLPVLSLCFGFALYSIQIHPVFFFGSALFLLLLEPIMVFLLQDPSHILVEALPLSINSYLIRYPLTFIDADTPFYLIKGMVIIRIFTFLLGSGCTFLGIRKGF